MTLVSSEIRRMINEFETRCPSLISMTSRFGPFQPLSRSVFTGLYSGVAKILYTTLFSWPPDVDRKWIKVPSLLKFFGFIKTGNGRSDLPWLQTRIEIQKYSEKFDKNRFSQALNTCPYVQTLPAKSIIILKRREYGRTRIYTWIDTWTCVLRHAIKMK